MHCIPLDSAQSTRRQFAGFIDEAEGCHKIAMGGRTWLYGLGLQEVASC